MFSVAGSGYEMKFNIMTIFINKDSKPTSIVILIITLHSYFVNINFVKFFKILENFCNLLTIFLFLLARSIRNWKLWKPEKAQKM